MTNVPDDIRTLWTDLYKLFDVHFKMDVHSITDWNVYWADAQKIWEKSGRDKAVLSLVTDTADLIINCSRRG
jgi:hypothetical protein